RARALARPAGGGSMNDNQQATSAGRERPGPVKALEELGGTADRAARAVACVGGDDVAAFECVVALDQALPHVVGLLRQVPELLRVASPGAAVSSRLASAEAELSRQQAALAAERSQLEATRDLEKRAAEVEAERGRLRE